MSISNLKRYIPLCAIALYLCVLGACSSSSTTTTSGTTLETPSGTTPDANTTIVVATSIASTPGIGPTVILSPTPVPGGNTHSQQVVLKDRTLIIHDVSKATGSDVNSTAIHITITLKNTGTTAITNLPAYYSLFGIEGDAFSLSTNTTGSFFGPIGANSVRNGNIVFEVPTAAATSLKLFYRSDTNESVFVSLPD